MSPGCATSFLAVTNSWAFPSPGADQHYQTMIVSVTHRFASIKWGSICGFQIGSDVGSHGETTEWFIPSQFVGIDITDWLIVAFTGFLVILTGFLVFYNWRLSKATIISANAAKTAADAATKQAAVAEKALLVSEFPDVHVAAFNALKNRRGTWELTAEIKSDRVVLVYSIHIKLRVKDALVKEKVRRVRDKVSPRNSSVAMVRIAGLPQDVETLHATVTVYYDNPLGLDAMRSTSSEYWIHRQPDNTVRTTKKDPKDRFKPKPLRG